MNHQEITVSEIRFEGRRYILSCPLTLVIFQTAKGGKFLCAYCDVDFISGIGRRKSDALLDFASTFERIYRRAARECNEFNCTERELQKRNWIMNLVLRIEETNGL